MRWFSGAEEVHGNDMHLVDLYTTMTGQKRVAVCDVTSLSQGCTCGFTVLSLSIRSYDALLPVTDVHLSRAITELALESRRFTYRSIWQS